MLISALREVAPRERRVALTPDAVTKLVAAGHDVAVEHGAGVESGFGDEEYGQAGATVLDRAQVLARSGVFVQVRGTGTHETDDGVLQAVGMVGFAKYVSEEDAEAIRQYVLAEANRRYAELNPATDGAGG